jgi:hypothetical protein
MDQDAGLRNIVALTGATIWLLADLLEMSRTISKLTSLVRGKWRFLGENNERPA